jgi:hypothetical protein
VTTVDPFIYRAYDQSRKPARLPWEDKPHNAPPLDVDDKSESGIA